MYFQQKRKIGRGGKDTHDAEHLGNCMHGRFLKVSDGSTRAYRVNKAQFAV